MEQRAFGAKIVNADATRVRWEIPVEPEFLNKGVNKGTVVIGGNEHIVKASRDSRNDHRE